MYEILFGALFLVEVVSPRSATIQFFIMIPNFVVSIGVGALISSLFSLAKYGAIKFANSY